MGQADFAPSTEKSRNWGLKLSNRVVDWYAACSRISLILLSLAL